MRNRLILVFAVVLFSIVFFYAVVSLIKIISTSAPDFNVYFGAANDIVHHKNPYIDKHLFTVFNYPVITGFFFIPFSLFPYQISQAIFTVMSFLAFCLIILLSLQMTKQISLVTFFLFFSLGFVSFPVKFTLGMGQSNLIAYAFLLAGFYFFLKQKDILTIIFLSIGIIAKPILLYMLFFFLLQKSWKVLFGTTSIVFLLTLLTYLLYPKETVYYGIHILPSLSNLSGREVYYNQGFMGFISRIIPNLTMRFLLQDMFTVIIMILSAFAVKKTKNNLIAFSLILTLLVMIDPLSWQHHFVFLLFPWIVILYYIKAGEMKKQWYILLALSYFLVSININNPSLFMYTPSLLILSHTFYGACILYGILIARFTPGV